MYPLSIRPLVISSVIAAAMVLALLPQRDVHAATPATLLGYSVGTLPGQLSIDQGAASYSIPIGVPPGIAGGEPELAFSYSSRAGNGPLGLGWAISGLSQIGRCAMTKAQDGRRGGVKYDSGDRYCLDGQRLIAINGAYGADGTEYRTEIDGFSRIVSYGSAGAGPRHFKVWTKAGQIFEYGITDDSRVVTRGAPTVVAGTVVSWANNRIEDAVGNTIDFGYLTDATQGGHYIETVSYAGNRVQFVYEARPDVRDSHYRGLYQHLARRLSAVVVHAGSERVSSYQLGYDQSQVGGVSRLISIAQSDAQGNTLPPTHFYWSAERKSFAPLKRWDLELADNRQYSPVWANGSYSLFLDINADGLPDRVNHHNYATATPGLWVALNNGHGFDPLHRWDYESVSNNDYMPIWNSVGENSAFYDMDGDGLPDRVTHYDYATSKYGLWVALNNGSGFDPATSWFSSATTNEQYKPTWSSSNEVYSQFLDINADGLLDRVNHRNYQAAKDGIWVSLNQGGWLSPLEQLSHVATRAEQYRPTWGTANALADFVDMNGDALPDRVYDRNEVTGDFGLWVALNNGAGFDALKRWSYAATKNEQYMPTWGAQGDYSAFVDVNGDGLPDRVNHHNSLTGEFGLWVALNLQGSFGPLQRWSFETADTGQNRPTWSASGSVYSAFVDINADGLPDRVHHKDLATQQPGLWVALNTGSGFGTLERWSHQATHEHQYLPDWSGGAYAKFEDVNGDGLPDRVYHHNYATGEYGIWVALNESHPSEMTVVEDGLGHRLDITYGALTDPAVYEPGEAVAEPLVRLRSAMRVVTATEDSSRTDGNSVSYRYGGGLIDREGRGFLGFAWEEVADNLTGLRTRTDYSQQFPTAGMPVRTRSFAPDGTMLSDAHSDYGVLETLRATEVRDDETSFVYTTRFPYLSTQTEATWERDGSPVATTVTTQSNLDEYGNIQHIDVSTRADGGPAFAKLTISHYENNVSGGRWHLGRLLDSSVTHMAPGQPNKIRHSAFHYDPITGLLDTEIIEPGVLDQEQTTTYEYDSFGNKDTVHVSAPGMLTRTTHTPYMPDGRFPRSTTNAMGHGEDYFYDYRTGKLLEQTGPNGLRTSWEYDSWGRQIAEHRADGTSTLIWRDWIGADDTNAPAGAMYRVSEQGPLILATSGQIVSAAAPPASAYYDRFGRVIRKVSIGFDNKAVYQDTEYDGLNREARSSLPYFAGETSYWVVNEYDDIGRLVGKRFDTGKGLVTTRFEFAGLSSTEIDSLGHRKVTHKNALGKIVEVIEEEGARVSYTYDAIGNLLRTEQIDDVVPAVVTTVLEYDISGRKTTMNDPDMGQWHYGYNGFGELIEQIDAKGQTTTMEYDALGRMVLRVEPDGVTVWDYDSRIHGTGKLAEVRQYNLGANAFTGVSHLTDAMLVYRQSIDYDAYGRVANSTTEMEGRPLYTATVYDEFSRVASTYQPNGFEIRNRYDAQGFLRAKQSPFQDVSGYNLDHLQNLLVPALASATQAWNKASSLTDQIDYFRGKATEYEGYLAADWTGLITVEPNAGASSPTAMYPANGSVPPVDGNYRLYVHTGNMDVNPSQAYLIVPNQGDGGFTLNYYPQNYTICIKACTTTAAGWYFNASAADALAEMLGSGSYADTGEQVQISDVDGDGSPNLIREGGTFTPGIQMSSGQLMTLPLAAANDELHDGTGYLLYLPGSEAVDAYSLYLHDPAGTTHYRIWPVEEQWQWQAYTQAEWDALAAGLEASNDRLFVGDFDADGTPDAIRLPASDPNQVTQLTDELKAELLALVEDSHAAERALELEADNAIEVAEQLIQVAASLVDKARQAQYWQATLAPEILNDMQLDNGYMTWWRAGARDAAGRLVGYRTGNGLVTMQDYDPATGHLNTIQTGFEFGLPLRHLEYEYDALDNVTARYNDATGLRETFLYDRLDRLTQATMSGVVGDLPYEGRTDYTYDALGNLLHKTGVGFYDYGSEWRGSGNAGPHALQQVTGDNGQLRNYVYDANGSILSGGGRNVTWTSYNKPAYIERDGKVVSFAYGPDRARYRKTIANDFEATTTLYLGKAYERVEDHNGEVLHKQFIYADGQLVAERYDYEDPYTGAIDTERGETRYMYSDALGSIDTITDDVGGVLEQTGYSPFGSRRDVQGRMVAGLSLTAPPVNRGFTGHEHLDDVGLIHMNGRVYDPEIGRFLSADPNIQAPYSSQNYNRYSYALNNPLKYTDPSGYFFKKLFKSIGKFIKKYWKPILAIALAVVTYGAMSAWLGGMTMGSCGVPLFTATQVGVMSGAAAGFVSGTILGGSLQAGLKGALSGAIMGGIAGYYGDTWNAGRVAANTVGGGVSAEVNGGSFKDGAIASLAVSMVRVGWEYTKNVTNELKIKTLDYGGEVKFNKWGEILTDGSRGIEPGVQVNPDSTSKFSSMVMEVEGSGAHSYSENGYVGRFVNWTSKTHDFMNSWGYDWNTGYVRYVDSVFYNTAYDIYSFSGMVPAAAFTGVAFSAEPSVLNTYYSRYDD